jgi:hypothetical protein
MESMLNEKEYIMDKLMRRPTAKPKPIIHITVGVVDKRDVRPEMVGSIRLSQDMAKIVQEHIGQVVFSVKLDGPVKPRIPPKIRLEPQFTNIKKVFLDETGKLTIEPEAEIEERPESEGTGTGTETEIEELPESEGTGTEIPTKKQQKKTNKKANEPIPKTTVLSDAVIHGIRIADRIPQPADIKKLTIRSSSYYMSNRKLYMQKLAHLFRTYGQELLDDSTQVSCERQGANPTGDRKLFIHQRIVREYLNIYTPYRGLLLYHGLGSGKTCTSIAIAEGAKTDKRVFVLTPASLKMNFFSELKKCGDVFYKKNQFWEFVSTEGKPENVGILAAALSISDKTVKKNKGAWLMNLAETEPNFAELTPDQQKQLDEQLNEMIRAKYVDINYNGLTSRRLDKFVEEYGKASPSGNPFDHGVVLIDEAHNLVSRIVNSISKRATASVASKLYELLMSAQDVRIVLMSGTPVINYPNEIGVLFNMLRGYIKTWKIPVRSSGLTKGALTKDKILDAFRKTGLNTYDYVDYANDQLTITRNPYGFVNKEKMAKERVVYDVTKKTKVVPANTLMKRVVKGGNDEDAIAGGATKSNIKTKHTTPKLRLKLKPKGRLSKRSDKDTKKHLYEIKDGVLVLNNQQIQDDDEEMDSDVMQEYRNYQYNQGESNLHRGGALDEDEFGESNNMFYGGAPIIDDQYNGVYLDEQGNLTDNDFIVAVKHALQRAGAEIVSDEIKETKYKSLPDKYDDFVSAFIDIGSLVFKREDVLKKRILGLTSYFRSAQESLLPRFVETGNPQLPYYHIENIPMSDHQFVEYSRVRAEEINQEDNSKKQQKKSTADQNKEMFKIASSYRVFSRACCNFAFPSDLSRPMPPKKVSGLGEDANEPNTEANATGGKDKAKEPKAKEPKAKEKARPIFNAEEFDNMIESNEDDVPDDGIAKIISDEYAKQQAYALDMLYKNRDLYLVRDKIAALSPKFLRILDNLENANNTGLHLVYSAFRTLEGIGILRLVLLANGFEEFKLKRTSDGWDLLDVDYEMTDMPRFVLYTGTESPDEKELIRNIYNSNWDFVPANIVAKLKTRHENNFMGEIIKTIMITSSGAEGINLENTRFVHIVEPYWHMVRVDQVVGRARRICSHKNLPEHLRTIQVFLYMSTFTELQRSSDQNKGIMNHDKRRIIAEKDKHRQELGAHSITTDESLFETATMKNNLIGQILKSVKETSVDCTLYDGTKEGLVCYNYGYTRTNEFGTFPKYEDDFAVVEGADQREAQAQIVAKRIQGKEYAYNPDTQEVYDYAKYKEVPRRTVYIGKYDEKNDKVV